VELTRRERTLAIGFYAGTSIATILWWMALIGWPESRAAFLGREFGERWLWILMAPDLLSALAMSTLMVWLLARQSTLSSVLAWIHFGSQGYAWAISIGLAVLDPGAYWGVVAMTFSAGASLAIAMRIQGLDILWGAFRFQSADTASQRANWARTLIQTAGMWTVFLFAIPLGFALVEQAFLWDRSWLTASWRLPVGILMFALGGSLGLWAGRTMTNLGDGTPLPSACARKLVVAGPYRFIRNPMAMGGIVQGIAVGLAIGSPLVMVYGILGGLWWEVLARHLEEDYLRSEFGEPYIQYEQETPCWRFRLGGKLKS
jgi:protein-S-isoprenylcysteine O-methyltransferase Ste14